MGATPLSEEAALARIDDFVARSRPAVFVRREDGLLLVRPDKTLGLNPSAAELLAALYAHPPRPAGEALAALAPRLRVSRARLVTDAVALVDAVGALLGEDYSARPNVRFAPFDRSRIRFPTLAEIALTYRCQNRCAFCYAGSPKGRVAAGPEMATADVRRVMERIFHEAHVPSLSFTGGESTLRADLPELVAHGKALGFRMNLITNGVRLADPTLVARLAEAGLDSVQVSLEAHDAPRHDAIVGRAGAFEAAVAGIANVRQHGMHVHTNTTLSAENLPDAEEIVRFVARGLGLATLSMNMVIRTGEALSEGSAVAVRYSDVAARLPALLATARAEGVRLVWYSPIPYCLFNPVLHGLGGKMCACVDGLLSVDPSGQLLPCSSFEQGLGSLLARPFARLFESRAARYWRRREYVPPPCEGCPDVDLCAGACPLYWDAAGSFAELPRPGSDDPRAYRRWAARRRRGRSFGVAG